MTTQSLPQDPTAILTSVEEFFDELPSTRRRKRTRAEITADYDTTPEIENYGPAIEPPHVIELDEDAIAELVWFLQRLGRARNDVVARPIIAKILDLLDLELDGGE